MKNKWYKKLISLSLVAVMALGLLAGCGSTAKETDEAKTEEPAVESSSETADAESSQESTEEEAGVTYPVDTDVTLTLAIQPHSGIAAHFESLQETPFWQTLCENTGVTVEVMEMDTNALELMLSSGDLPDMVWCNTSYLPGGANASIEDGIIISLTDYLDDYMPDLKALLETDEEVRKGVTTTGGDIYCAPMVR